MICFLPVRAFHWLVEISANHRAACLQLHFSLNDRITQSTQTRNCSSFTCARPPAWLDSRFRPISVNTPTPFNITVIYYRQYSFEEHSHVRARWAYRVYVAYVTNIIAIVRNVEDDHINWRPLKGFVFININNKYCLSVNWINQSTCIEWSKKNPPKFPHLYANDQAVNCKLTSLSNSALSLQWGPYYTYIPLSLTFSPAWTRTNCSSIYLKPNFFLLARKNSFLTLQILSLGNDIIPVNSSDRNLGFIFDSDMSFSDQSNSVSKSSHFLIRDIRRIRHLLLLSAAIFSSKLDKLQFTILLWHSKLIGMLLQTLHNFNI